jgi:hypothetical protein
LKKACPKKKKGAFLIYLDGILKTLIVTVSVAMVLSPKPRESD